MEEVKTIKELLRMGGKFYRMNDESWCDTALDSWKLVEGKGYVRQDAKEADSCGPAAPS